LSTVRVCSIQLDVSDGETIEKRRERVNRILSEMSEGDADIILLPELWPCGFFDYEAYYSSAEDYSGETARMISEAARKLNSYILGGSMITCREGKYYNTSMLFGRDGSLLQTYDKLHLFGYESKETKLLEAGSGIATAKTDFGCVGLATCYDLRFPEQFRAMTDAGTEILLVVSDWPEARLEHWRLFNQVRALENQSYLISCNCAGELCGVRHAGHSMIVSPDGTIVKELDDRPGILKAEIETDRVREYRSGFPALADRCDIKTDADCPDIKKK